MLDPHSVNLCLLRESFRRLLWLCSLLFQEVQFSKFCNALGMPAQPRTFPGKLGGQHTGPSSPRIVPPSAISVLFKQFQNRWSCNSFLPVCRQKDWTDSMIYRVSKLTCALNMTGMFLKEWMYIYTSYWFDLIAIKSNLINSQCAIKYCHTHNLIQFRTASIAHIYKIF